MSKHPSSSTQTKSMQFSDSLEDNAVVEWLAANKQYIVWGALALFALLILAYRLITNQTVHAESDFFQAQSNFIQLQQQSQQGSESTVFSDNLTQLDEIMQRHPELHAKYDGWLAQMLLIENNVERASVFADSALRRTQGDHLTHFQDFSKITLLISKGNYSQALEQALALKDNMSATTEGQSALLYVFNLIRLAMLHQQLDQPAQELQAWKDVQAYSHNQEAIAAAYQIFTTGEIAFDQYIQARLSALQSKS